MNVNFHPKNLSLMDILIISKQAVEAIQQELKEIKTQLYNITSPSEHFIDNKAFVKLMGVSFRTAQAWRDEGKIGFSQEGKKIYYRMSDIDAFLKNYHKYPFAELRTGV